MERVTLKQLLEEGPVFAPCVYDCLSAKITEQAGFKAMCLSGGELAASYCGLPDIGLVSLQELTDAVGRISASCPLPMIVDIDTGFGNELNVIHTCRKIARAGAMAVHMEDQTFPKRCGHLQGKEVIPLEDYIGKVKAASYALKDTDCLLIARTDAYQILGKEAAIERAVASVEAGAQITLVEGTQTLEAIEEIGRRVPGWKMFGMASAGASPKVTYKQLVDWGYNLITVHCAQWGAIKGMEEFSKTCLETGGDSFITDRDDVDNRPIALFNMFGLQEWMELGRKFSPKINEAKEFDTKS